MNRAVVDRRRSGPALGRSRESEEVRRKVGGGRRGGAVEDEQVCIRGGDRGKIEFEGEVGVGRR